MTSSTGDAAMLASPAKPLIRAAQKGCAAERVQLREAYESLRRRLEQLEDQLAAHQREDEAKGKPVMHIYKCLANGCGRHLEALGGIKPGESLRCPVHGASPLDLVSPRP